MTKMLRRAIGRLTNLAGDIGRSRHVTDDQLLEVVVGLRGADVSHQAALDVHLAECSRCEGRVDELRQVLEQMGAEAAAAFDDAVSAERLANQKGRIMRRIERAIGRPAAARVLRFPAFANPALATVQRARPWLGVAAAAGLMLGVTIGQLVHVHPEPGTAGPAVTETRLAPTLAPASASQPPAVADEQFMLELEEALTTPRVSTLVALDEMTPRLPRRGDRRTVVAAPIFRKGLDLKHVVADDLARDYDSQPHQSESATTISRTHPAASRFTSPKSSASATAWNAPWTTHTKPGASSPTRRSS